MFSYLLTAAIGLVSEPFGGNVSNFVVAETKSVNQLTLTPIDASKNSVSAGSPSPAVGIMFGKSDRLNQGQLIQKRIVREERWKTQGIEYVDKCGPDEQVIGIPRKTSYGTTLLSSTSVTPRNSGRGRGNIWFFSTKTLPAQGLRVLVRNVTQGMSPQPYPYTNREYDKGTYSERFVGTFGDVHESRYLSLAQGKNDFAYEIKQGDRIIESGNFSADINIAYEDITDVTTESIDQVPLPCREKKKKKK